MVFATRTVDEDTTFRQLPEMPVTGLGDALALLELPRGRTPAPLAFGLGLPSAMPLAGRIEQGFSPRLEPLPAGTRRLLLTAAVEPLGDVNVRELSAVLPDPVQAASPAWARGRTHPLAGGPWPLPPGLHPGLPRARPGPGRDDGSPMRSPVDIVSESGPSPIATASIATAEEAADFQSVRPRLFGIAYRLLGRASDAEDVVQDVWVRWQGADRAGVQDRVAFLVKITTRLALNVAVSAHTRREVSVDSWFPSRVLATEDPTVAAERSAELEQAVLLLLQRLSPVERAVFVLREAFDYPFRDIAERLGISEANARQLGRRARTHLAEPRRAAVQAAARDRLLRGFLDAARAGAVTRLERLLVDDVPARSERGRVVA